MRDIPMFTTENGIATLVLKKIPYTKEAFVRVLDSQSCAELLKECIDICRIAGAEIVYATGHQSLDTLPVFCEEMCYIANKHSFPHTDAVALHATMEQLPWWRQIYNQKMSGVHAAAPLGESEVESLIREGKAFCVYKECAIVGIGVAYDGQIHALASLVQGAGPDVVLALAKTFPQNEVSVCVASTNHKALQVYRRLGFCEVQIETKWYKIF